MILAYLKNINLNTTSDQPFALPACVITRAWLTDASTAVSVARLNIYTGASKTGYLVCDETVSLTSPIDVQPLGLQPLQQRLEPTLYLSMFTPEGSPATASLILEGFYL